MAEILAEVGSCKDAASAFESAIKKGYEAGKAWVLIGNCYYDQTRELDRLKCDMTPKQIEAAPISQTRHEAIVVFQRVPQSSDEYKNAQKWLQFIEAEKASMDKRCDHGYHRPDLCYLKIKQAYDAAIFTDGFNLEDESCRKYIPDYDAEFRPSYSEK